MALNPAGVRFDYTGDWTDAVLFITAGAGAKVQAGLLPVSATAPGHYFIAGNKAARLRVQINVRRITTGVTAQLYATGGGTGAQDTQLVDFGAVQQGMQEFNYAFGTTNDNVATWANGRMYALQFTWSGAGEIDIGYTLKPYQLSGWKAAVLTSDDAMAAVEDSLYNTQFISDGTFPEEIRLAKSDIFHRLVLAGIEPDAIYTDGLVYNAPEFSGVGFPTIPELILPSTYLAVGHAFRRISAYKEGMLADKADYYFKLYEQAMASAVRSLSYTKDGDYYLNKNEIRAPRSLQLVR